MTCDVWSEVRGLPVLEGLVEGFERRKAKISKAETIQKLKYRKLKAEIELTAKDAKNAK